MISVESIRWGARGRRGWARIFRDRHQPSQWRCDPFVGSVRRQLPYRHWACASGLSRRI